MIFRAGLNTLNGPVQIRTAPRAAGQPVILKETPAPRRATRDAGAHPIPTATIMIAVDGDAPTVTAVTVALNYL